MTASTTRVGIRGARRGLGDPAKEVASGSVGRTAVALAVYFTVSRAHMAVPLLAALQLPIILNLVALLSATAAYRTLLKRIAASWVWKSLLLIAAFATVGVVFSIFPGRSFEFLFDVYLKALLIGLLVFLAAGSGKGAVLLGRSILAGGVTAAILALIWARRDVDGRLSGAFTYDANDLALLCCVTIPFAVWFFFHQRNVVRWLGLGAIPLLLFVILKTGSRGGFLGLSAVCATVILLSLKLRSKPMRQMAAVVVVGAVVAFPLVPGEYRDRILSIGATEEDYNFSSYSGRLEVWKRGLGYVASRPVFGVGIDNFRTAEGKLSETARERRAEGKGVKWSAAHNSFLQVLVEIGLIPGVLFFWLTLRLPAQLALNAHPHRMRADDSLDFLAVCTGLSLVAFAVCGFFLSFAYYDIVYVLYGLGASLLLWRQQEKATLPHSRAAR